MEFLAIISIGALVSATASLLTTPNKTSNLDCDE